MTGSAMERCLVTGATGFIGRALCTALRDRGVFVRGTARRSEEGPWDEFVAADLATGDVPSSLLSGIDTVIHLAGKVHALCTRGHDRGRDWYDLVWYRSRRPPMEPNLTLLQNALDQTEGAGAIDGSCWPDHLLLRIESLDPSKLADEIRPFLERPAEADLLTREGLATLLGS